MEKALFFKIADELMSEKKSPLLVFALHGEPLLDKNIFEYIRYVKSQNPKSYCIIPTNGELLDTFTTAEIEQSGINQININLGAFSKETYERIYVSLDYERVRQNVDRLLAEEILKQRLQISFVINRENENEAPQSLKYWKQQGIRTKVIQLQNRAGSLETYEKLRLRGSPFSRANLLQGWKYLMVKARRLIGCELPFFQMNILFNGDVILCCHDWNRKTVIGNVKDASLAEVWNSPQINEARRLIWNKQYEQLESCKKCSLAR
jgi:radical SAM protein with 4Fe4S-binding SPASM domain